MDQIQQIYDFLIPHWPGLAWTVVAMMIGQVASQRIFTRGMAHQKGKYQWVFWWGRKTLPLHPVAAGFVLGLLWHNPERATPPWPHVGSMMYFGFFGGMSTWAYEVLKGLAKQKGVDLDLPGGDSVVPGTINAPKDGEN